MHEHFFFLWARARKKVVLWTGLLVKQVLSHWVPHANWFSFRTLCVFFHTSGRGTVRLKCSVHTYARVASTHLQWVLLRLLSFMACFAYYYGHYIVKVRPVVCPCHSYCCGGFLMAPHSIPCMLRLKRFDNPILHFHVLTCFSPLIIIAHQFILSCCKLHVKWVTQDMQEEQGSFINVKIPKLLNAEATGSWGRSCNSWSERKYGSVRMHAAEWRYKHIHMRK